MANNRTLAPAVLLEQLKSFKAKVESVRGCQESIRALAEQLEARMPNLQARASKGKRGGRERRVDAAELNRLVHCTPEQKEIEQQRALRQKHEGDARRVRGLIVQLWRKMADRDPGQLEHFLRFEESSHMPEPADLDDAIRRVEGLALESTVPATGAGADIDVACPATPEQQGAVEVRTPLSVSKESLAAERRQLLEEFRTVTKKTAAWAYKKQTMPDKSEFYRWLRGEIPAGSSVTTTIERHLREALASTQKS